MVKKEASPAEEITSTAASSGTEIQTQTELSAREQLERKVAEFLRPRLASDSQARKLTAAFITNIERRLGNLSLDDIERICAGWNKEEGLQF